MLCKPAFAGALIAAAMLSPPLVSARTAPGAMHFPRELQGVWEGGVTSCRKPGNLDSDQRIEIQARKLLDYEQWQELIEVSPLSKAPLAWSVRSKLHIDDESTRVTDIFLLSGKDHGLLTVVNDSQSTQYVRCR